MKEWNKKMKNAVQTDLFLFMVPEKLDEAETVAQISLNGSYASALSVYVHLEVSAHLTF